MYGFDANGVQSSHSQLSPKDTLMNDLTVSKGVVFVCLFVFSAAFCIWNETKVTGHCLKVMNLWQTLAPKALPRKFPPISRSNSVRCISNDSSSLLTVHPCTYELSLIPNNPLPHLCPSYPLSHLFSNPNLSSTPCTLLNHQPSVRPLCLTW